MTTLPLARSLLLAVVAGLACLATLPAGAQASGLNIFGRNATKATLKVNRQGIALVEYTEGRARKHVLAWGAINTGPGNTRFKVDYSGGWKSRKDKNYWRTFRNACAPYDGPALSAVVPGTACKAPDGSYWVLQSWTRLKPNYGGTKGQRELRLSHWTGDIAKLEIHMHWGDARAERLFGRYSYGGRPVHGFRTTARGNPLDDFGRNVYIDSHDGAGYTAGWARANSFVAQKPYGNFCFAFNPKKDARTGDGLLSGARHSGRSKTGRYRASVIGPGVTPDLVDQPFASPGAYDLQFDLAMGELSKQFAVEPGRTCYKG